MVRSSRITCSSAAAVAMAGAGGSSSSDDDEAGEEIESAPPLRVGEERAIGSWGIRKRFLRAGQGWATPVPPDEVSVHYVGTLPDDTVFASTRDGGGEPRTINLGSGDVIAGLERGICTMKKGEKALFILPPLAYEDSGALGVPIEQVTVGLDRAVATMVKGELAEVTVKFEYGFGNTEVQRQSITVPSCSTLIYEVELIDFTKEKESWAMSAHEKLEAAEKSKVAGNDLFKIGKFQRAAKKYNKALNYINEDGQFEDEVEKLMKTVRVSCWLNHAACCLKLKDFAQAISLCSKVLETEPCNVKALYRRAQAYVESYDLELAKTDLRKALELDPNNKEVKLLQANLKKLQVESNKRDAKLYANMFDRIAKESDAVSKKRKVENASHNEEAKSSDAEEALEVVKEH
ncbi:peptidyl-prolyl cis-trans isomerase FKBP62-like [Panicum miliaceum]|uniref:peptidylprolyl isomerase n=1 Tax=Panicum miliaceum TaxID=4540 RepID=A0A3L6S629_PANMI|nr:peptidyl-prolyl cis-trans isomerase FKBP62-like [Panicum miliaceum]